MKNTKWVTLGIAFASVSLVMAQETDIVRERVPAEEAVLAREVAGLAEQRAQLATTAGRLSEVKAQADSQRVFLTQAGGAPVAGIAGFGSEFGYAPRQRTARALVIPKEANDAKTLSEVEEDLGVMSHILDKAVSGGDRAARAMGISVFSKYSGGATPQNLFIEGHGAIFLLNVNFPLQPPPKVEEEAEAKEPVNNEWEEARREITQPGKSQGGGDPFGLFEARYGSDVAWNGKMPLAEYDADKVEDLKKNVIAALKNAANIRRLKSDETVTVVVTGVDAATLSKAAKSFAAKPDAPKGERATTAKPTSGERARVAEPAKLIIRARKADAEAFQNGKLDFDAFRKKVTMLVY